MNVNAESSKLTSNYQVIDDSMAGEEFVKYLRISFSDSNYMYSFTFDVTEMFADQMDIDNDADNYIVYMSYNKYKK